MPRTPRPLLVLALALAGCGGHATTATAQPEPTSPTEPAALFNGEDFAGWVFDQPDTEPEDVVTYEPDGVVRFSGDPQGALLTDATYTDYVLTLEWRWPEGAGNSGVLLHASGSRVAGPWPKCLEPQLQSGDAGDLHGIGGFRFHADHKDEPQEGGRAMNLTDDTERELGEWNSMVVRCEGDTITVHINGVLVNSAHDLEATSGRIGLQSEGKPIEFRKIELRPLD